MVRKKVSEQVPTSARGRNAAILPPINADFDTALSALLRTPPPTEGVKKRSGKKGTGKDAKSAAPKDKRR